MAEGNIYPTLSGEMYNYGQKPIVDLPYGESGGNIFPSSNPSQYNYNFGRKTPTLAAQPNPSDNGLNSAQQQMVGNAIGGGVDAGIKITQGLLQMPENDKARTEARGIAMQNRDDQLKQERIELGYRKRQQELEQQAFETNKRIEKYNTKFSIWQNKFKRELENQQKSIAAADELFSLYNTSDEKTQQALVRSFI